MDILTDKCPKCGKEIGEGDKFCVTCGGRLTPKTGRRWVSILIWPITTIVLLFGIYPPRLGEDYNRSIFYMLAFFIGVIATVWMIGSVGRQERRVIIGPALSLLLVFFSIMEFSIDTSGSGYRMKGWNAMALSELRNAKTALGTYYADKKIYPKTLGETEFKSFSNDENYVRVEIIYDRTAPERYRLTSSHKSGNKEYMCSSDGPVIYQRHKKEPEEKWQPM